MYIGLTGALSINNKRVAYISGWSIEDNSEIIKVRKIGSSFADGYAGMQSWSASANGAVVFEGNGGCGQQKIFRAKHQGEKVDLNFYLKDGSDAFSGTGLIESLSVDLAAEGTANISISIKGTGILALDAVGKAIKTDEVVSSAFLEFGIDDDGELVAKLDRINENRVEHVEAENKIKVQLGRNIISPSTETGGSN